MIGGTELATDPRELYETHARLVGAVLHEHYRHCWTWRDDLTQEGLLGLWQAALKFDPARGVKFRTFAKHRVLGAMRDWIRSYSIGPLARRRKHQAVVGSIADEEGDGWAECAPGCPSTHGFRDYVRARVDRVCSHWAARKRGAVVAVLSGSLQREQAEEVGVTPSMVCQWMRDYGRAPNTPTVEDLIAEYAAEVAA